jgi:2-polyprenyl-3-methyl-5-hydroxy-6-metoxy-1,4-benzoquinol methylase
LTDSSRVRRAGRRLKRVPLLGPAARDAYAVVEHRLWRHVLTPLRHRRLAVASRLTDIRNRHRRSASNVTRKNTRSAYERLYADPVLVGEYLSSARRALYEHVADVAAESQPSSIADIGCGTGHLLRAVLDRTNAITALGVDYATSAVDRARELVPDAELVVADVRDFRAGRTYDVVLCTEVLEHLAEPDAARETLGTLVAPGGRIIVTVPDGETDDWEGHANFWSLSDLERFLAPLGAVDARRFGGDILAVITAG